MKKRYVIVLLLIAFFAYSYTWTNTEYGKLDYKAAFSLKLLTFTAPIPVAPDLSIEMPINLLFTMGRLKGIEEMASIQDVSIPVQDTDIRARIYRPSSDEQLPILVYYHGGGFVLGDIDIFDQLARGLAAKVNAIVVSVEYRLAPVNPYPTPVNDAYDALLWVVQNHDLVKGNVNKLFVAGDSAGGNLAAVVSMRAKDENGPDISGQILFYPAVDLSRENNWASMENFSYGYGLDKPATDMFLSSYLPDNIDKKQPLVSPLFYDAMQGLPPTLIATAGFDPLRDSGMAYVDALINSGVEVTHKHFPTMLHGFMSVALFDEYDQGLEDAATFVAAH